MMNGNAKEDGPHDSGGWMIGAVRQNGPHIVTTEEAAPSNTAAMVIPCQTPADNR